MATPSLTTVTADDWTILRAIARRVLSVGGPEPFRHPSCDQYWQVERSAIRLAGYLSNGEMTIDIVVPGHHDADDDEPVYHSSSPESPSSPDMPDHAAIDSDIADQAVVRLGFDDGLEPIIVPWHELELVLEPAPRRR